MNALRKSISMLSCSAQLRNYWVLLGRNVAYKSAISLEALYPNSSLQLTTPTKPESSMSSTFSGYIPIDQLDITYTRSSGPGGQNVNKVNTKVNLQFNVDKATWLDPDLKEKLKEKLKTKITKEGNLIIRSDLTRSQQLNLADCLRKLRSSILEASYEAPEPSLESQEKARRRLETSARIRLIQKRIRSQTKEARRAPDLKDL